MSLTFFSQAELPPQLLSGTWYVTRTSLPMWRNWDNPTISYAPLPGGQISDTVRATRQGRERLIVGIDTPLPQPATYEWRGVTLLTRWTPSRWQVLAGDPDGARWLITLFGATRFTPAGLDICTRQPWLLPEEEQHILRELADRPEAAPFIPQLFVSHHDWHRPASTAQTEDK